MTLNVPITQSITLPESWQACKTPQELSYWIIARLDADESDVAAIQSAVEALQASISTISAQAAAAEAAANQANTVSTAAQGVAEDALTDAASAQTVAGSAQSKANLALNKASTAQTSADDATVLANSANTWIANQIINLTRDANFSFVVSNSWTPQYINGRVLVLPIIPASDPKTNLFANFAAQMPSLIPTAGTSFYIAFNGTLPSDTDIDDFLPASCSNGAAMPLTALTANAVIEIVRASNINASGEAFRWVPVVQGD